MHWLHFTPEQIDELTIHQFNRYCAETARLADPEHAQKHGSDEGDIKSTVIRADDPEAAEKAKEAIAKLRAKGF